jgi:hypothetical protein
MTQTRENRIKGTARGEDRIRKKRVFKSNKFSEKQIKDGNICIG